MSQKATRQTTPSSANPKQQHQLSNRLRIVGLLAVAVMVSFIWVDQGVVAGTLFQSPVSPVEVAPPPKPPPPPEQPPPPQPQPAQDVPQPAPTPTPEANPVEIVPIEAESEQVPEAEPPVEVVPVEPASVESPQPEEAQIEMTAPDEPAADVIQPPPPGEERPPVRLSRSRDELGVDDPQYTLNEAQLIDTVIVSTAWVWLCCGVIIFLLIPLVFLFLQIQGRSKILKEEAI